MRSLWDVFAGLGRGAGMAVNQVTGGDSKSKTKQVKGDQAHT